MLSSFWEETFNKYFDGDVSRVPFMSPQRISACKQEMKVLGRILEHGWRLTKKLPI